MSSTTDAFAPLAPPHTPDPPPRVITGIRIGAAQDSTVATSSVLVGKTTAAGSGGSSPLTLRSSPRVQLSMARSRSIWGSVVTAPRGRRLARDSIASTARIVTQSALGAPVCRNSGVALVAEQGRAEPREREGSHCPFGIKRNYGGMRSRTVTGDGYFGGRPGAGLMGGMGGTGWRRGPDHRAGTASTAAATA